MGESNLAIKTISLRFKKFKEIKTEKMSLATIQGKLSTVEIKNIMANPDATCLGRTSGYDCQRVNKSSCSKECPGKGYNGCSGG